jgi:ABC-type dipeptide/oligopeptide/nickel transport system ATPase component/ABC-type dipeptide/oligopeptide/nickel transport system permease subunit
MSVELIEGAGAPTRPASRFRLAMRRFRRDPLGMAGLVVLVLVVLVAALGPTLWPYGYSEITDEVSAPPSAAHPLGTDTLGRDMLALVMRGLQQSLLIAASVAVISSVIGTVLGVVSGFLGRVVDGAIMRVVDLVLTVPTIAVAAFLGSRFADSDVSWLGIALVLGGLLWTSVARIVRGVVLRLRTLPYIDASQVMGASRFRIMLRHLVPNVSDHITVATTLLVGVAILAESGLSFLGFGVQAPDTSLGLLIATAQNSVLTRPWLFYFPGALIIVIVLAVNYLGEGIRNAFNPRSTTTNPLVGGRRRRSAPRPARAGASERVRASTDGASADGVSSRERDPDRDAAGPARDGGGPDDPLVRIRDLTITFPRSPAPVVDGVSLDIARGEVLALVGESGSGKSLTSLALAGLLPIGAAQRGEVRFDGLDVTARSFAEWRRLRGLRIATILQDPSTSLNPVLTIGAQFSESFALTGRVRRDEARARATELLRLVAIRDPETRLGQYPHQMSGGMRQRIVIAMAMIHDPDLIIADEPTTALDVTVQSQVLDALRVARERTGAAMLFISHDLALVAGIADRVAVMKEGRIVEQSDVFDVFARPRHDYTRRLLELAPVLPPLLEEGARHDG